MNKTDNLSKYAEVRDCDAAKRSINESDRAYLYLFGKHVFVLGRSGAGRKVIEKLKMPPLPLIQSNRAERAALKVTRLTKILNKLKVFYICIIGAIQSRINSIVDAFKKALEQEKAKEMLPFFWHTPIHQSLHRYVLTNSYVEYDSNPATNRNC